MNFVDAPLIVNASANEFYKQPMWHVMGHFSKFVPVDSYRIDANWDNGSNNTIAVGFLNPDGTRTAVILNQVEIFQLQEYRLSRMFQRQLRSTKPQIRTTTTPSQWKPTLLPLWFSDESLRIFI